MDQNVNDNMKNPWIVSSMFDFCYFCCPECDDKSQSKEDFVHHASDHHDGVSLNYFCWRYSWGPLYLDI